MTDQTRPRTRRTPEQARKLVLEAAARRLAEHGLKGLNVADVARDAGMTHATVLHHFGSAEQMQRALVGKMTADLLTELVETLGGEVKLDGAGLCARLFETFNREGHGKLIAWAAVTDQQIVREFRLGAEGALFAELVASLSARLRVSDETARRVVYLITTTAVGAALTGDGLATLLGMDAAESGAFPTWLSAQIDKIVAEG